MSTCDADGDCCDAYYENPDWCGDYDWEEFSALMQCCSCHDVESGN